MVTASPIAAQAAAKTLLVLVRFVPAASTFCFILFNSAFASTIGPLPVAFAALGICSFKQACASSTAFPSWLARASNSAWTAKGVAKASRSASSLSETSGLAASSNFSSTAVTASSLSFAGPVMASASARSLSSMCALRSDSSFLAYSFLATAICLFNFSSRVWLSVTFGFSFMSSPLAFFNAASCRVPRSAHLDLNHSATFPTDCTTASIFFSASWTKVLYGEIASKNTVPWFPCAVTQPVTSLETILHCIRVMPVVSSLRDSPLASNISPICTLERHLVPSMAKLGVMVMFLITLKRLWNISLNLAELMPPSAPATCSNMAFRLSAENVKSSRSSIMGSFSRYPVNVSSSMEPLALPPLASLNMSSCVESLLAMCLRSASNTTHTAAATRNSAPPSSRSGAQAFVTSSISSSAAFICPVASVTSFMATNFDSYSFAIALAADKSVLALSNRSFKSSMDLACTSSLSGSFFCLFRNTCTSSSFCCAVATSSDTFSHKLLATSAVTSETSASSHGFTPSVHLTTSASASVNFSAVSSMSANRLCPATSFLKRTSRSLMPLMRSCCFAISSMAAFEASLL
mmetsp:Transcript_52647/g.146657  ORF Transcript_52647/g.146657 Transcript_52647/m.146657 type:complete len:579 (+) Transcript_52647:1488-3224(+)